MKDVVEILEGLAGAAFTIGVVIFLIFILPM